MQLARQDLDLHRAFVVHPGEESYPMADWAEAVAIGDLSARLRELGIGKP